MKIGGGKRKGSAFERQVGLALSLWVSEGQRSDLFARTVLSGGQFTVSKDNEGVPGDLMANNPLAFKFMALFSVECKHQKDIGLGKYLLDVNDKSFLGKVVQHTTKQADIAGVWPMIVAKQNHYDPVVLLDFTVGEAALTSSRASQFRYHVLHNQKILLTTIHSLVSAVRPRPFLEKVQDIPKRGATT